MFLNRNYVLVNHEVVTCNKNPNWHPLYIHNWLSFIFHCSCNYANMTLTCFLLLSFFGNKLTYIKTSICYLFYVNAMCKVTILVLIWISSVISWLLSHICLLSQNSLMLSRFYLCLQFPYSPTHLHFLPLECYTFRCQWLLKLSS